MKEHLTVTEALEAYRSAFNRYRSLIDLGKKVILAWSSLNEIERIKISRYYAEGELDAIRTLLRRFLP